MVLPQDEAVNEDGWHASAEGRSLHCTHAVMALPQDGAVNEDGWQASMWAS
jgi:hypothetical protein